MPTIGVNKADLYKALGKEYTKDEFDELCFEFGLELDEDTSESKRPVGVDGVEEAPQLKIEIPANRYDMLCFEGIAMNLNVFLGRQPMSKYRLAAPPNGELQTTYVSEETKNIRPYFSCAILRNIKFTKDRYESFIALQDRLHQNLARQRTLVAIGTHDLDTIEGPFSYEALPPEQIKFAPLNQTKEMNGKEMMEFYEKDKHLSRYLNIIRKSPVYPVIYDKNRTVLSMPPIINSNHTKITLDTTNVYIDITATDKTKLEIVNHIIVSMFSQYCSEPFTIEPVKIVSKHNGETRETPNLTPRATQASAKYLNSVCGLSESRESLCKLLSKMCYQARPSTTDEDKLDIDVPITRADVLHEADIMEDVAIAYGFNNLPRHFPGTAHSVAAPLPINKLADIIRLEAAMAGWAEVMPLILCSHDENYGWLQKPDDGKAVRLQNPKTAEYQIVRTSLIPGLLKTVRENKHHSVPMKVFEVADVVFKDMEAERRSRNERHFAACWYGKTSGFEQVHGLLDRVMLMLKSAFATKEDGLQKDKVVRYWIEEVDDSTYLDGHAAAIYLSVGGEAQRIGTFGILHPKVLRMFELPFPTSTLEINVEVFL
ncbi:phenylalanine--tRNA ligase subunit beta [Extremus antarcticus]|uniref:Phenylalanine--tRNA ligase beta subunit n=1 Tax=Extremus antarcticus TaxID=702011 RepID=A0AAJ0DKG2_9PEZI|nr:phenylalanine--tRNA ligase subunit beta [Extremus antarcticus]